jgi:ascorbate-specific PTS system EIIC-type component UlaA
MTLDQVVSASFAIIGFLIVAIGAWIANSLGKLTDSVQALNVSMAVVVEKINSHEERIEKLEQKEI